MSLKQKTLETFDFKLMIDSYVSVVSMLYKVTEEEYEGLLKQSLKGQEGLEETFYKEFVDRLGEEDLSTYLELHTKALGASDAFMKTLETITMEFMTKKFEGE